MRSADGGWDVRYAFLALLAAHGIAHLPGFLVPWRLLSSPDLPWKTTLLWGWVEVGEAGIRAIGIVWLLTGLAVVATAVGLARQAPWAASAALPVVLISGLLCVIELPHARIGLALNVVMCLVLGLHPTMGAGALRWRHATEAASGRLVALAHTPVGTSTSVSEVQGSSDYLPIPVAQYFEHVLQPGSPAADTVTFTQRGEFRMGEAEDSWRPFTATQVFSVHTPGFVWDARIAAAPLMPVHVRDSYIDGTGGMVASVLGLFTVMNAPSTSALDAGALQRYLAEAVWFPQALRGPNVAWESLDERSARATVTDRGTVVSLVYEFADDHTIARIWTPARAREVQGTFVDTPWEVVCLDWELRNGTRIPTRCEVSWHLDSGLFTYWKGRIV